MIALFTDFGLEGPYVGQVKAVLQRLAPDQPVIDLMHDAPAFNPKAAGYLLSALADEFPEGTTFLTVVDPGVGTKRLPVVLHAGGQWFVGPDNGLLAPACRHRPNLEAWEIVWRPKRLSNTFHGRDLFAPIVAEVAQGIAPNQDTSSDQKLRPIEVSHLDRADWPHRLSEIIYIDRFGNGVSGLSQENLSPNATLLVHNIEIKGEKTFGNMAEDTPFWYVNSNGLIEIACNRGRADLHLGMSVGTTIELCRNQPVTGAL